MPSSFFNKPNFAIGMTALAFLLYLALAKFDDRGGVVAGLRPSDILGSPLFESASSTLMKLWGCEKEKPPPEDSGGENTDGETGEFGKGFAPKEEEKEEPENVDDFSGDPSSEEDKAARKKKKQLESQLEDMMKVDLRLEALEEKWKEIRKRTHDRVLKSYRRFKKIRNELYGERSETVGNLSATALRQSSVPGQIERLQSQLDFLKDTLADVDRSKTKYFETMDTEVLVFKNRYEDASNGLGAIVERVEGMEALLQKLQGSLAWPQQKIQIAVEEFQQAEREAKEEAERKAAARRAQQCNKGTFAKDQSDNQEQCAFLDSEEYSSDPSGATEKCETGQCLHSRKPKKGSAGGRQFVAAIDDIDPAVFEYPDPSSVEASDNEEDNAGETKTQQGKNRKKKRGIFKSWWGSSQGEGQGPREESSETEENMKQKPKKKFHPGDDADAIEGFFPTDRFSSSSGISTTVTEASIELKKIIDEANQLKLDAQAVAELAKKIDEKCTELFALKWNILQAQAERPADPDDKIQSLPLLMHMASSIDYHSTALQDSEKKLMDLKRATEAEKTKLISVLNEILDILDALNSVSEDEGEMRKLIDERNALRKELTNYYKIIEEYHCLNMRQEGQAEKANVTAQCTFEGVSGRAAEYANCLTRYMLRIKQLEADTVNYNEDLSHAAVLKDEFTALKSDAQGVIRELFAVLKTVRVQELALTGGVQHYSRDSLKLAAEFARIDTEISEELKKRDDALWRIFLGVDSLITRLGDPHGIGIRAERIRDGLNVAAMQAEDLCSRFNCAKVTPEDECKVKAAKSPEPATDSMSEPQTQGVSGNLFGVGGIFGSAPTEEAKPIPVPAPEPPKQQPKPQPTIKYQEKLQPSSKKAARKEPAPPEDPRKVDFDSIFSVKHMVVASVLMMAILCVFWIMMGGSRTYGSGTTTKAVRLTSSGKGAAFTPERIVETFPDQESIYEYSLEKGLILCTLRCPNCGKGNMALPEVTKNVLSLGQRACSECSTKIPVTEHTVFSWNPHSQPIVVLLAMWAWSHKKTIKQARHEISKVIGEAPSLETVESIYMMCKTVAERFLKLCPAKRNEEHYSMFHRFECCNDFILGGQKEVVEVYMDYALPNGDAVFLGKERCSDRAMMRSTSRVTPETIEAFVTQFVSNGSVVILPDNAAHTDLTLIDGYEFTLCDRDAAPKSTITRSGHPITVSLESVLRFWELIVPEMTNDVSDELHLAIYLIESTWFKYFGCEAGYDPMNTFVEQAAYAFSQWSSCDNKPPGRPDVSQEASEMRSAVSTAAQIACQGHYPSGTTHMHKKKAPMSGDHTANHTGYIETQPISTAAVTTYVSTPMCHDPSTWDDDRHTAGSRTKRGTSTVTVDESSRWCYIPSPYDSRSVSPETVLSGVNLDMLRQNECHGETESWQRSTRLDEPVYLDLAKSPKKERQSTNDARDNGAKCQNSVGVPVAKAVRSHASLVKRFGSRALADICRNGGPVRSKSSETIAVYH